MGKWLRAFEREYARWEYGTWHENALLGGRTPINRVRFAYEAARDFVLIGVVARLVCHYRGCRIQDDSSFGPDSGSEHLWCDRCGWSFDHTYY